MAKTFSLSSYLFLILLLTHWLQDILDSHQDEFSHELSLQRHFMASLQDDFVGRKTLLKQCINSIAKCRTGLFIVTGSAGTGKSAFMVKSSSHVCRF